MSLEVTDLGHRYGTRLALRSLSVRVEPGEIVGLLGPNGAGKSTAIAAIAGELKPASGTVLLDGQEIQNLPTYQRARKGLVYLPQEPSIFADCTVWENMLLGVQGLSGSIEQARERLEQFGIHHLTSASAGTLSGGERRRLELARCLVGEPRVLLLDEPFSGVDPIGVRGLQEIITALAKQGVGVLVTDHSVEATLRVCSQAIILEAGEVIKRGCPEEVVSDTMVRERYLGTSLHL